MEIKSTESPKTNPLVTFALFTFNQERFIAEAVRGALSQTYSPLEIIISDDCSTDSTFEIIQREVAGYAGRHTVRVNRNELNSGFGTHINKVMQMAKGQLIVVAAGDDVSLPERVAKSAKVYLASGGDLFSIYSNACVINDEGIEERLFYPDPPNDYQHDLVRKIEDGFTVLGATNSWDRRVFDVFGFIGDDVTLEDWVIPFRAALLGNLHYIDEPLVLYRRHGENLSLGAVKHNVAKAEWYGLLLKRVQQEIPVFKCWLHDLTTAERLYPQRGKEIAELRRAVVAALEQARDRQEVFAGTSVWRKLIFVRRLVASRKSWRRITQHVLTFLLPDVYLWRMKRGINRIAQRNFDVTEHQKSVNL